LVQLTAIDNKAGVKEIKYSFDGIIGRLITEHFFASRHTDVRIMFFAEDNVGNKTSTDLNLGGQGSTRFLLMKWI
jgi:hypothetical protein